MEMMRILNCSLHKQVYQLHRDRYLRMGSAKNSGNVSDLQGKIATNASRLDGWLSAKLQ